MVRSTSLRHSAAISGELRFGGRTPACPPSATHASRAPARRARSLCPAAAGRSITAGSRMSRTRGVGNLAATPENLHHAAGQRTVKLGSATNTPPRGPVRCSPDPVLEQFDGLADGGAQRRVARRDHACAQAVAGNQGSAGDLASPAATDSAREERRGRTNAVGRHRLLRDAARRTRERPVPPPWPLLPARAIRISTLSI